MAVRVVLVLAVALTATAAEARRAKPVPPAAPPCAGNVQSSPFFGCANANNLEAMVADPRDLVRGREQVGSDAILEAAAGTGVRTDKGKPLRNNSTVVRQSGTSQ